MNRLTIDISNFRQIGGENRIFLLQTQKLCSFPNGPTVICRLNDYHGDILWTNYTVCFSKHCFTSLYTTICRVFWNYVRFDAKYNLTFLWQSPVLIFQMFPLAKASGSTYPVVRCGNALPVSRLVTRFNLQSMAWWKTVATARNVTWSYNSV